MTTHQSNFHRFSKILKTTYNKNAIKERQCHDCNGSKAINPN